MPTRKPTSKKPAARKVATTQSATKKATPGRKPAPKKAPARKQAPKAAAPEKPRAQSFLLADFLAYFDSLGSYAWDFSPGRANPDFFRRWLGRYFNSKGGKQLRRDTQLFAADGGGGHFSLWSYDKQPLETTPVVYFDTEGEVFIVADNPQDFACIVAAGKKYLSGGQKELVSDKKSLTALRSWLKGRGVELGQLDQLWKKAQKNHPDVNGRLRKLLLGR